MKYKALCTPLFVVNILIGDNGFLFAHLFKMIFIIFPNSAFWALEKKQFYFLLKVEVPKPDLKGRTEILQLYLSKIKHDNSVDLDKLARLTVGMYYWFF